jgi:hypothetical protein
MKSWIQRANPTEVPPLGGQFWVAFLELVDKAHKEGVFPDGIAYDPMVGGGRWASTDKLDEAVKALVGLPWYGKRHGWQLTDRDQILTYAEALYVLAASKYRERFQAKVNELLNRFNQPYEMRDGKVEHSRSAVLDHLLEPLPTDDEDLHRLLREAQQAFFYAKEDRKMEGLRSMAQALERLKTLARPSHQSSDRASFVRLRDLLGEQGGDLSSWRVREVCARRFGMRTGPPGPA